VTDLLVSFTQRQMDTAYPFRADQSLVPAGVLDPNRNILRHQSYINRLTAAVLRSPVLGVPEGSKRSR
jgi:hypothetical protein